MSTAKSAVVLLVSIVTTSCFAATANQAPAPDARQEQRLASFKARGSKVPIAVWPGLLGAQPVQEVGDVVALLLEQKAGLDDVSSIGTAFKPPADADLPAVQRLFAEHVRKDAIAAGYALLAQFVIRDQKFAEVRTIVVDHAGDPVWADAQHSGDADFDRVKPGEPLECCLVVAERVRGLLGLAVPSERREGKMTRAFAEKSGTPSEAEQVAMQGRVAALAKSGNDAALTIFPVRVAGALDVLRAGELAKQLSEHVVCHAIEVLPTIDIRESPNEQIRLWDLARSFKKHLQKAPVETEYALIADYVMDREREHVGAVHFVLCTRNGEWVIVDYQNDHHADFQSLAPHSVQDCDALVVKRLAAYLHE